MLSQEPTTRFPVSELIWRLNDAWSDALFQTFLHTVLGDQLGVIVTNLRAPIDGKVVSTKAEPLHLGNTRHGDGKSRILAFADPPLFRGRYGDKFNAEISAPELFRAALSDQTCAGILVNGALKDHSVAIDRAAIQWALDSSPQIESNARPWWRFW